MKLVGIKINKIFLLWIKKIFEKFRNLIILSYLGINFSDYIHIYIYLLSGWEINYIFVDIVRRINNFLFFFFLFFASCTNWKTIIFEIQFKTWLNFFLPGIYYSFLPLLFFPSFNQYFFNLFPLSIYIVLLLIIKILFHLLILHHLFFCSSFSFSLKRQWKGFERFIKC